MRQLCDDLDAEHEALDRLVAGLSEEQWGWATPADDWAVRDQISHLWFFDQKALLALTDVDAFARDREQLLAAGVDDSPAPGRAMSGADLLAAWRRDRRRLSDTARNVDPTLRVPWYGPSMAARSFITARLMETWAHGVDIADTLGTSPPATARLQHVAHLGVRARPYAYLVNGKDLPEDDVRVEITAPDGTVWTWGDDEATNRVTGTALEFCLVVTQRRHVADTAITAVGDTAREWMGIAQAFAGPAGPGRQPGQFAD